MLDVRTSKRVGKRADVRLVANAIVRSSKRAQRQVLTAHVPRLQPKAAVHGVEEDVACGARRVIPQPLLEPFVELER
jgi:hypothetical protein